MKRCNRCGEDKTLESFHVNTRRTDGRQSFCIACKKKNDAEYFQKNKKRIIDSRKVNKDHHRAVRYGITVDELNQLRDRYDGKCWVCQEREGTDVDHCHVSLNVRGWLCNPCNRAIGLLRDNVETIRRAADYLDGQLGLLEAPPGSGPGA